MSRITENYGAALQQLTDKMSEKEAVQVVERFVEMLGKRHELHLAPKILEAYGNAADKAAGVVKVRFSSADDVSDVLRKKIESNLEKTLDRPIDVTWQTDPSLVGGAVIRYDDVLLDASVKGSLDRLKQQLI